MLSLHCSKLEADSLDLCLAVVCDYTRIVSLLERKHALLIASTENEQVLVRSETALFKKSIAGVDESTTGFDLGCLEKPRQKLMDSVCSSIKNLKNIEKIHMQICRWRGSLNFYKRTIDNNFDIEKYAALKNNNTNFDMQEHLSRTQISFGVVVMIDNFGNEINDMAEVRRILNLHPSYTIASEVRTVPSPEYEEWLDPVTYQLVPKSNNRCTIVTVTPSKPVLRYYPPLPGFSHD